MLRLQFAPRCDNHTPLRLGACRGRISQAEGIRFDLNGYSLDLNGHNLAIYSYAGADITLTDHIFDTSAATDADAEYTSAVKDSAKGGLVILFHQRRQH